MLVEILNNFEYHHLQNDFYHKNGLNGMFLFLFFFNSFSTIKCFVFFEVIFLLWFISLSSKSAFVSRFACANLAAKFSGVKLLNSGVIIYLPSL